MVQIRLCFWKVPYGKCFQASITCIKKGSCTWTIAESRQRVLKIEKDCNGAFQQTSREMVTGAERYPVQDNSSVSDGVTNVQWLQGKRKKNLTTDTEKQRKSVAAGLPTAMALDDPSPHDAHSLTWCFCLCPTCSSSATFLVTSCSCWKLMGGLKWYSLNTSVLCGHLHIDTDVRDRNLNQMTTRSRENELVRTLLTCKSHVWRLEKNNSIQWLPDLVLVPMPADSSLSRSGCVCLLFYGVKINLV